MKSADIKVQLRQALRERRRSLSPEQREQAANATLRLFKSWVNDEMFPMALYLAFDGELDPSPIIEYCWATDKTVYLPVVSQGSKVLTFAKYTPETKLVKNQYGILQPQVENSIRADTLRTLLMPLTAFDNTGARIGMGGGYYDATVADCQTRPKLFGLAYAFQEVATCPVESHDEPISGILTDQAYIDFS